MKEVYIVVKQSGSLSMKDGLCSYPFVTNEAVFSTERAAKIYMDKRIAANDRDDRGCQFAIEPWHVE